MISENKNVKKRESFANLLYLSADCAVEYMYFTV